MISVLGLSACEAERRLAAEGVRVVLTEVRSRKGTVGDDARVVRQQLREDGTAVLTYARFAADLSEDCMQ